MKLYVKRVFIMDDTNQLLPHYLRFIKGVIDSEDLPLNVSREILQQTRDLRIIRDGTTKRVLSMLEDLAANRASDYDKFWALFGNVLKEGLGEDPTNKERIAKLLRFVSTGSEGKADVTLEGYISRMKTGQDTVYYQEPAARTLQEKRHRSASSQRPDRSLDDAVPDGVPGQEACQYR